MPPITDIKVSRLVLGLMLIAYLIVAGLFAARTPPWQAPDEPAHYNYAAQVAENGCCPTIEQGDWDSAYLDQLKSSRFAPELLGNLDDVQYEDHQPPLYYLLQSLVYRLTDGSLVAMRFFSALFGLGIIWSAYTVGMLLLPERPQVALGAAALVAFIPQQVAILASVNNDSLAGLIIGVTFVVALLYLRGQDRLYRSPTLLVLGLLAGLGLLTKVSTLFLIPLVLAAIGLRWWREKKGVGNVSIASLQPLLRPVMLFLVPALALGGIWWVRSISVYGFPDIFGLGQHNEVVADQARTGELIASIGFGAYLNTAIQTTFNSFWGQFGWMALPLPEWMYWPLLGLLIAGVSGLFIRQKHQPNTNDTEATAWRRDGWLIMALAAALAAAAYLYYNLEFLQLQGRYLFAGIIPFGLGIALGVDHWRRLLLGRYGWSEWLTVGVFLLFIPLNVYLILRVIEPLLKP
jgi:uncharacterized membrane protein